MGRPTNWEPLRGSDPTPGDPGEVATMARQYTRVASAIEDAAENLRKLADSGDTFESDAVDAFDDNCEDVAEDIERAHTRYDGVAKALTDYWPELSLAQRKADGALYRAQNLGDLTPDERMDPDGPLKEMREAVDAAEGIRDEAARIAIAAIKKVEDSGDLNDSWWDNWGAKVVQMIQKIASTIALVAGILALCVGWIPIIGQALAGVLGTIALVCTVISLVCNIALAATGYGSWTDVGWDVLSLATFGAGRVFSSAARATSTGTRGASRIAAGRLANGRSLPTMANVDDVANLSRRSARNLLRISDKYGTVNGQALLRSLRTLPGDFGDDFGRLLSRSNWSQGLQQAGPAFRNIFAGGRVNYAALYGNADELAHLNTIANLSDEVRNAPQVADLIRYTSMNNGIATLSNMAGNANDFRDVGTQVFDGHSGDFDLNIAVDPLVK